MMHSCNKHRFWIIVKQSLFTTNNSEPKREIKIDFNVHEGYIIGILVYAFCLLQTIDNLKKFKYGNFSPFLNISATEHLLRF